MALYKKKFENVYEKNLTSDIGQIETVDVTENTTLTYTKGLHIDANGKTFSREAQEFEFNTPDHKVEHTASYSESILQYGISGFYWQANAINTSRAFSFKTEESTSYNLAGLIFANPSPIKVKRTEAFDRKHPNQRFYKLLCIKMSTLSKVTTSSCTILYKLHMKGL